MLDLQGVEITVGARVVYAAAGYNHAVSLRIGEVERLIPRDPATYHREDALVVRPEDGGRSVRIKLTGTRNATKVMVL